MSRIVTNQMAWGSNKVHHDIGTAPLVDLDRQSAAESLQGQMSISSRWQTRHMLPLPAQGQIDHEAVVCTSCYQVMDREIRVQLSSESHRLGRYQVVVRAFPVKMSKEVIEEKTYLSSPVQGCFGCKGRVVHTLLLKCRDKDKRVQLSAYEQLASMDFKVLHENMRPFHWRAVLDAGLGAWAGAQLTQGKTTSGTCFYLHRDRTSMCILSSGAICRHSYRQDALHMHQAVELPGFYRRRPLSLGKPQMTKARPLHTSVHV